MPTRGGYNGQRFFVHLIESCRRRKVDPWKYLVWIFEELPKVKVTAGTFASYTPKAATRSQWAEMSRKTDYQVAQRTIMKICLSDWNWTESLCGLSPKLAMIPKNKLKGLRNLHAFVYRGNRVVAASVYESSPNAHLEGRKNRLSSGRLFSSRFKKERHGVKVGEIIIVQETGMVTRDYSEPE